MAALLLVSGFNSSRSDLYAHPVNRVSLIQRVSIPVGPIYTKAEDKKSATK